MEKTRTISSAGSPPRSIDIEPRLRRLLGYRHLPSLRAAIQKELRIIHPGSQTHATA